MAENGDMNFSLEFNNHLPDTPNPNELLSLKMLKDVEPTVFLPMYKDQVNFLTAARGLLMQDAWLQTKLGGCGLDACSRLAKILRKRSNELHLQKRIDGLVNNVNTATLNTNDAGQKLVPAGANAVHNGTRFENFYRHQGDCLVFEADQGNNQQNINPEQGND